MLPRKFDTLLALKMIALMPELSGVDKRVAATIHEHFNRKTGQCDPSIDRIARLVGIGRRGVIRSIRALEKLGILSKTRHGGKFQRNSYQPNWQYLRHLEANWKVRFKNGGRTDAGSNVVLGTCQTDASSGVKSVTQTTLQNQFYKTLRTKADFPEAASSGLVEGNRGCPRLGWP